MIRWTHLHAGIVAKPANVGTRERILRVAVAIFAALLLSGPATAQAPSGAASQEAAPAVVRPIPQSLISVKMQETMAVLEFMHDRHGPDAELDEIRAAFPMALANAQDLLELQ